jgi:hypothetical protein
MMLDILRVVDMKEGAMFKAFRKTRRLAIEFCERCFEVCDAGCRAAAIRERAQLRSLRLGPRF